MFAYCGNNPVIRADYDGLSGELAAGWVSTMWWLPCIDGPFPVGDIIYWGVGGVCAIIGLFVVEEATEHGSSASFSVDLPSQNTTTHSSTAGSINAAPSLSDIASKYGLGQCKEAAEEMYNMDNRRGRIVTLFFRNTSLLSYGGVYVDHSRFGAGVISKNGIHVGYMDSVGLVHCNVFPAGCPLDVWISYYKTPYNEDPIVSFFPPF